MTPQCERVLSRLKIAPLTPMEAWAELGVYRLGARIYDLRQSGHDIKKETVAVMNRFGEACHVARYRLANNDINQEQKS